MTTVTSLKKFSTVAVLLAVVVGAMAFSSVANGATLKISGSTLSYTGGDNQFDFPENNVVRVYKSPATVTIQEIGDVVYGSAPYAQTYPSSLCDLEDGASGGDTIVCVSAEVRRVKIDGRGGDDQIILMDEAPSHGTLVLGGRGNDIIVGSPGPTHEGNRGDILKGGLGNDRIDGRGGRDRFIAGPGDDYVDAADPADEHGEAVACGSGYDRVILDVRTPERDFRDNGLSCEGPWDLTTDPLFG